MAIQPQRLRVAVLRRMLRHEEERHEAILAMLILERQRQRRRERRWWVKPWIERRRLFGQYYTLFRELERESEGDYMSYVRMSRNMFAELLLRVTPRSTKSNRGRGSIEPGEKLVITLRFLATGMSFKSLRYAFRVAHNTISLFFPEGCRAIYDEYRGELFTLPSNPDQWREVAQTFGNRWNFHHACGAIDGKHVAIKKPHLSGSEFFNYKGFCSIVLLGVADAEYKFLWASVESNGSASDAGIFIECSLRAAFEDKTIGFPPAEPLPQDDRNIPFVILGDDAFPLRTWLMKPYSMRGMTNEQRVFNYRQSRARRVVENAFGILAHRWRCLLTTLQCSSASAISIVLGAITLHNWMRTRAPALQLPDVDQEDEQGNVILGAWRQGRQLLDGQRHKCPLVTREAKIQRDYLCAYYISAVGRVPWQDQIV